MEVRTTMLNHGRTIRCSSSRRFRRPGLLGFTLVELLVVMGVIAVLGSITVISIRTISRDARLSSGKNAVLAALGNARATAIKRNKIVAVVFRVKYDTSRPTEPQHTEIVIAEWRGDCYVSYQGAYGGSALEVFTIDRFMPIEDIPPRSLPVGIKVAAPFYDIDSDDTWITQPEFVEIRRSNEAAGRLIGVMFAPDGTVLAHNPLSDSRCFYVDFSNGNIGTDVQQAGQDPNHDVDFNDPLFPDASAFRFWDYDHPLDEPFVNPAPFIAVYDDEAARTALDRTGWSNIATMRDSLSVFITDNANRIHFNRYTGVPLK